MSKVDVYDSEVLRKYIKNIQDLEKFTREDFINIDKRLMKDGKVDLNNACVMLKSNKTGSYVCCCSKGIEKYINSVADIVDEYKSGNIENMSASEICAVEDLQGVTDNGKFVEYILGYILTDYISDVVNNLVSFGNIMLIYDGRKVEGKFCKIREFIVRDTKSEVGKLLYKKWSDDLNQLRGMYLYDRKNSQDSSVIKSPKITNDMTPDMLCNIVRNSLGTFLNYLGEFMDNYTLELVCASLV